MGRDEGRRVVVVGAGIGGVAAASALGRRGWRVTLLERAGELGEVGAGISVWPAAQRVLDELGATERLRREALPAGQAGLRRPDGKMLVAVDSATLEVPLMVHRARLHDAITATFGPEVEVRTGVTVVSVEQAGDQGGEQGGGVMVRAGGGEVFRADVVVAADGIRSVVRSVVRPESKEPRYSGYTAYRGIAPAGTAVGGGETWGRGQRFGFVPLADGRIYWYATANRPAATGTADDPVRRPADDAAGRWADVRRLFGGWHEPVPAILAATPADGVLGNDVYDLPVPLVPFAAGRVALLGDAAHAMTPNLGQGACAAIEDAAALARLLDEYDDPAAALTAYDVERRGPTAKLIRRSRLVGAVGQLENRAALAARDAVLVAAGRVAGLVARRGSRRRARD